MTVSFRRFEILLPRLFNDGRPVPDALFAETVPETKQFFVDYKAQLKLRFEQIEIWITSYPIELL